TAGLSDRHGDVPRAPRTESRRARALAMRETSGMGEGVDAMTRMSCEEAVRQFFAYLDRALSGEPLEALEAHLQDCVGCCGGLRFGRRREGALKARLAAGSVPEGVEDRVRERLAKLRVEAAKS